MGFDLKGLKPKQNTNINTYKLYGMIEQIESFEERWRLRDAMSENDQEQYWKEYNQYNDDNPGVYFRNNCWWWRPLWNYVCQTCSDILTDKDQASGNYNDGHEISRSKAKRISKRLFDLVDKGLTSKWQDEYEKEIKKLSDSEDEDDKYASQYPFSEGNVKRFAVFCKESGGFTIC